MSAITVTTQAELDAALARTDVVCYSHEIMIDSPPGVRIEVSDSRGLDVRASGTATVHAYGTATVWAYGTATVRAFDTAAVRAYDMAVVRAYDMAVVRATSHVAVHRHSARAAVYGGVLIDVTQLDLTTPTGDPR